MGKTRLADEALRRAVGRFADGVAIVELATVHDDRIVALGVQTRDGVTTPLAELSTDDGATWRLAPASARA